MGTELLDLLIRLQSEGGELDWEAVGNRPVTECGGAEIFFDHLEEMLRWIKDEYLIVSTTIDCDREIDAMLFSSVLSERAVAQFRTGIHEPGGWFGIEFTDPIHKLIPIYCLKVIARAGPLIKAGAVKLIAEEYYSGTLDDPTWSVNASGAITTYANCFDREFGAIFRTAVAKSRLVHFGSAKVPSLIGVGASEFADLMNERPFALSTIRDAVAETISEIANNPSPDRARNFIERFEREVRGVDREYRQLISRRHNMLAGAAVSTGVVAFCLLMPEPLAATLKPAAGAIGGLSVWNGVTNIWTDKSKFEGLPHYFAWKAHKLDRR